MQIIDFLKKECVRIDVPGCDKKDVIRELAKLLLKFHPEIDAEEAIEGLYQREGVLSTGIGRGVAIPHARLDSCREICIALGLLREGTNFESLDKKPVKLVFLILFPKDDVGLQLKTLAKLSRILLKGGLAQRLLRAQTTEEVIDEFEAYEKSIDSQGTTK